MPRRLPQEYSNANLYTYIYRYRERERTKQPYHRRQEPLHTVFTAQFGPPPPKPPKFTKFGLLVDSPRKNRGKDFEAMKISKSALLTEKRFCKFGQVGWGGVPNFLAVFFVAFGELFSPTVPEGHMHRVTTLEKPRTPTEPHKALQKPSIQESLAETSTTPKWPLSAYLHWKFLHDCQGLSHLSLGQVRFVPGTNSPRGLYKQSSRAFCVYVWLLAPCHCLEDGLISRFHLRVLVTGITRAMANYTQSTLKLLREFHFSVSVVVAVSILQP